MLEVDGKGNVEDKKKEPNTQIGFCVHILIYIYICVCGCVCVIYVCRSVAVNEPAPYLCSANIQRINEKKIRNINLIFFSLVSFWRLLLLFLMLRRLS